MELVARIVDTWQDARCKSARFVVSVYNPTDSDANPTVFLSGGLGSRFVGCHAAPIDNGWSQKILLPPEKKRLGPRETWTFTIDVCLPPKGHACFRVA